MHACLSAILFPHCVWFHPFPPLPGARPLGEVFTLSLHLVPARLFLDPTLCR